jgi:hypothetical protein
MTVRQLLHAASLASRRPTISAKAAESLALQLSLPHGVQEPTASAVPGDDAAATASSSGGSTLAPVAADAATARPGRAHAAAGTGGPAGAGDDVAPADVEEAGGGCSDVLKAHAPESKRG